MMMHKSGCGIMVKHKLDLPGMGPEAHWLRTLPRAGPWPGPSRSAGGGPDGAAAGAVAAWSRLADALGPPEPADSPVLSCQWISPAA